MIIFGIGLPGISSSYAIILYFPRCKHVGGSWENVRNSGRSARKHSIFIRQLELIQTRSGEEVIISWRRRSQKIDESWSWLEFRRFSLSLSPSPFLSSRIPGWLFLTVPLKHSLKTRRPVIACHRITLQRPSSVRNIYRTSFLQRAI